MTPLIDLGSSLALVAAVVVVLATHAVASAAAGRPLVSARVERERGLPLVGRAPMHAVYRPLVSFGRLLASAGVSANTVSTVSLAFAISAAVAFGLGHLGLGAATAAIAALLDAVDGIVARESGTASKLGQVLDTTIDRYVDALLLGGLAIHVHDSVALLVLVMAAIVGSFMVSYASSIERELGVAGPGLAPRSGLAPMRRAHRLAFLLAGAALGPILSELSGDRLPGANLLPVIVAVLAIAVVGNVSAVRRIFTAARLGAKAEPARAAAAAQNTPTPVPAPSAVVESTPR